ncbi:50S ribosomal protein L25/general stress protein Ctc [Sporosarcina sp. Te-1]|uniref:50S ribosomal protein L25/general stress protein Ctc n=1 Tax=Sporosarcina sp. Te-1 TaxID=2818390 RepID=UPI001A9D2EDA|nr:50S ribosomal protein L25/general stress protein Ctc [Sporosarcina sp. Te-1]QTD40236.1 50S ribosomal protein L25/general stress protein Ctc [Sporosarcina sp. Te-1]
MSTAIQSKLRAVKPKSTLTKLRKDGFIPSVVYGYQIESMPIAVKERDLLSTLREVGRNGVLTINVEGKDLNVVLEDYQEDALNGAIYHADFLAINMTEELEVNVTVHLVGEAPGEKEGGVLQQPIREVTIKVKPSDIPETFDVDISNLQIGESISVKDIRESSSFELLNDDEEALVVISAPRAETDEDSDEAGEGTEPVPEVNDAE